MDSQDLKKLYMQRPCNNCPFTRSCTPNWLGESRAKEILNHSSFVCHKTTDNKNVKPRQCAGHMIIKKRGNEFYALAKIMNLELFLSGESDIFDSHQDFINHHKH